MIILGDQRFVASVLDLGIILLIVAKQVWKSKGPKEASTVSNGGASVPLSANPATKEAFSSTEETSIPSEESPEPAPDVQTHSEPSGVHASKSTNTGVNNASKTSEPSGVQAPESTNT